MRQPRNFDWVRWAGVIVAAVAAAGFAASRCGDGVCEGPETPLLCPQDCSQAAGSGSVVPNPPRAVVSQELTEWRDWLVDGGFEEGVSCIVVLSSSGTLKRDASAARSGSWGLSVIGASGETATVGLRSTIEKGEDTRFSLWARSPGGPLAVPVRVLGVERSGAEPVPLYTLPEPLHVTSEWTKLEFALENRRGLAYVLLTLDVASGAHLYLDDAKVEATQWKMAEPIDGGRVVGGVNVPADPVAPVRFAVLIHIEDPALLQQQEAYFRAQTAIFRELARILHEHGGALTIQPEEDWALGAERFAPSTLADLTRDYGVVYSSHTHGPNCVDSTGRPRSAEDCSRSARLPGWDVVADKCCSETVPVYVSNLQELLSRASGVEVTDHNGNWEYARPDELARVGVETWSAFKSNETQRTFDVLMTNPWRPSQASARDDTDAFLTHDPSAGVIYVPGWGQSLTQNLERVSSRLAPMASQFIRFADPSRVNTFYVVTHVGHFESDDGSEYIGFDPATGGLAYSEAFLRDLKYWNQALSDIIDPLVTAGYLEWTSLPEMGRLFEEWERAQHGDG